MPQIEVTFETALLMFSAKDKATGKEQQIRIRVDSSYGLEELMGNRATGRGGFV
jgi:molecular chaperone DnaK (HSP70)